MALTLIVLVWYAYDTHSIARVTRERWERDGVLSATYSMELASHSGPFCGRTVFRIHNPSTLLVRARVTSNFRIYGEPISYHPLYDGKEVWLVFPQQTSQGWYDIVTLLQMKGKTIAGMVSERTPVNAKDQLTMSLELEFSDELGAHRKLPPRPHYFDFERNAWIPQLADTPQS